MAKKIPNIIQGEWSQERLNHSINRRLKQLKEEKLSSRDITTIWEAFIQQEIAEPLSKGRIVKLSETSKLWVKATKTTEHKRAMSLMKKGLMYKGGMIVEAKLNYDTSEYIYKIVYENEGYKYDNKVFFKADAEISKAVREGIKTNKLITRFNVN